MSTSSLVVGWDGADWDLVQSLGRERLPRLFELFDKSEHGRLQSIPPYATLPNWLSFLTGKNPGEHGVFDFARRQGYQVLLDGARQRATSTWIEQADRYGQRCALIAFPGTWPPAQLQHGVWMSGWDSPVAFEADASYVFPQSLFSEVVKQFGPQRFDDADQWNANDGPWLERLADHLIHKIRRKRDLGLWLLRRQKWDVFAIYFGESDTASHFLWHVHDAHSPRRPPHVSAELGRGLSKVYEALDESLGALIEASGQHARVALASDHGSGGSSTRVLHLNKLLEEAGWLTFKKSAWQALKKGARKTVGLAPPRARHFAFQHANRWAGRFESKVRFGNIHMPRTLAFSDELNYFPSISWNIKGREPHGVIQPSERDAAFNKVHELLIQLSDPETGERVVKNIWRREDLFKGPWVDSAPDVIIEFNLKNGYSYNLMPSVSKSPVWERLDPDDYGGRKGRCLPGSHRACGLHLLSDATQRHLTHTQSMLNFSEQVFSRHVSSDEAAHNEPNPWVRPSDWQRERENLVEQRLQQLGYFD